MENPDLINRCIQNEPLAWNEFVKQYSGLIYWAIENRLKKWNYLYRPQDVEEIHQNVFTALWEKNKLERLKDQRTISAWLIITSGNEAIDYFRRKKCQAPPNAISLFEEIIQKDGAITMADLLPSAKENPCAEMASIEIENILENELNRLSPKEKDIIKLSVLYNKKYREIAEILHMPVGSVSTALKNIKQKLKRQLKGKI